MRATLPTVFALVLLAGISTGAQQQTRSSATPSQPTPTFKTDVDLIEVHAVVTDERGRFVAGLARDDFEIFEDGRRQQPSLLQVIDVPVSEATTATPDIESDVRTSQRAFNGRLYVIVLDDLHTATLRSSLVRDAAARFINRYLGPDDLAAVVYTSGRREASQELTNSKRLLLAAVDRFAGQKLPSASAERLALHMHTRDLESANTGDDSSSRPARQPSERLDDPFDSERGFKARRALELVKDVANWMADVQGRRKSLVMFSEGIDYDIYDVFNNKSASSIIMDARDAIAAAQRANVAIYAVDPRGLTQLADESIAIASLSDDPQLDYGTPTGFQRELLLAQESLMWLAEDTGGLAVVRSNDIAGGLARIVNDNSRYYVLGYVSDSKRPAGQFRKIDVRVKRPGVQVRARRGYVPSDLKAARTRDNEVKAGTSPALAAALNNPLALGDLPVRVTGVALKGTEKTGSVVLAIELDGSALPYKPEGDRFANRLEFSIVAADHHAKVQATDRQEINLKLKAETRQKVTTGGIRVLSRLHVPPGRYQIRVGVHEAVGGALTTVPYDIEVPNYAKVPFSMSPLALSSPQTAATMTAAEDVRLKELFPMPPVASRTFMRNDTVRVFTEWFDRSTPLAHDVAFEVSVRSAVDGRTLYRSRDTRTLPPGVSRQEHYSVDIPLKDLPVGSYVVRVEGRSLLEDEIAASREALFEIKDDRALTW